MVFFFFFFNHKDSNTVKNLDIVFTAVGENVVCLNVRWPRVTVLAAITHKAALVRSPVSAPAPLNLPTNQGASSSCSSGRQRVSSLQIDFYFLLCAFPSRLAFCLHPPEEHSAHLHPTFPRALAPLARGCFLGFPQEQNTCGSNSYPLLVALELPRQRVWKEPVASAENSSPASVQWWPAGISPPASTEVGWDLNLPLRLGQRERSERGCRHEDNPLLFP